MGGPGPAARGDHGQGGPAARRRARGSPLRRRSLTKFHDRISPDVLCQNQDHQVDGRHGEGVIARSTGCPHPVVAVPVPNVARLRPWPLVIAVPVRDVDGAVCQVGTICLTRGRPGRLSSSRPAPRSRPTASLACSPLQPANGSPPAGPLPSSQLSPSPAPLPARAPRARAHANAPVPGPLPATDHFARIPSTPMSSASSSASTNWTIVPASGVCAGRMTPARRPSDQSNRQANVSGFG